MDTSLVLELVRQVQGAEEATRDQAQANLVQLGAENPGQLATQFIEISGEGSVEVNTRQMALVLLRFLVSRHWSIGFEAFTGPPIHQDMKESLRPRLLQLLGAPERKVQSLAAKILSRIAAVEFPEEWPELIDNVMSVMQNGSEDQIRGALEVMKEILRDALSIDEFLRIGGQMMDMLYNIASNDGVEVLTKCLTVLCFKEAMMFYEQMESYSKVATELAQKNMPRWFELFGQICGEKVASAGQLSAIAIKIEIMQTIKDISIGVQQLVAQNVTAVFSHVWDDICRNSDLYTTTYLENDSEPRPDTEKDAEYSNVDFYQLLTNEFSFVVFCLEDRSNEVHRQFASTPQLVQQLAAVCLQYAQIPKAVQDEDDMNEFVSEENDMCMDDKVRFEVSNVLCNVDLPSVVEAFWNQTNVTSSWIMQESWLYLVTKLLADGEKGAKSGFNMALINQLAQFTMDSFASANTMLQSRALLLAGQLMNTKLDATIKPQLLQRTLSVGSQSPNETVRAASLFSVRKYPDSMKQALQPHQEHLFSVILSLVEDSDLDTPAFLVEILETVVHLDFEKATQAPNIIQLLFTLASKDTSNLELTTQVSDLFEDIVTYATKHGIYNTVYQNSLPTLLGALQQMKNWEYTSDTHFALGLIGELIGSGPTPLPQDCLQHLLGPLHQIITNSTDTEVLQAASETFDHLVEHDSERLKSWTGDDGKRGPTLVLEVVSKLLDPNVEDSASINSGKIISTMIAKFGSDLGDVFGQLIKAATARLAVAENLVLVQSLVSVFCDLTLQSPEQVVDILSRVQVQQTVGLQIVLAKWVGSFDALTGYDEIKKNVVALQRLFDLNDTRIKSVIVDGDVENPDPNVIITRSKAKDLKFEQIPAHIKIIKLLVNELATTPFDDTGGVENMGPVEEEDDDDEGWEDEPEISRNVSAAAAGDGFLGNLIAEFAEDEEGQAKRQVDTETHNLLVDWFKRVSQTDPGNVQDIYRKYLKPDERNILIEHVNL